MDPGDDPGELDRYKQDFDQYVEARSVTGMTLAPTAPVKVTADALLANVAGESEAMRYTLNDLMVVHPTMTQPDAALVQTMAAAIHSTIGRQPPLIASPGTYDQKHFARIAGIEQCIAYGPGILQLAHQPDEYCEIEHLLLSCKAMALAAMHLTGVV